MKWVLAHTVDACDCSLPDSTYGTPALPALITSTTSEAGTSTALHTCTLVTGYSASMAAARHVSTCLVWLVLLALLAGCVSAVIASAVTEDPQAALNHTAAMARLGTTTITCSSASRNSCAGVDLYLCNEVNSTTWGNHPDSVAWANATLIIVHSSSPTASPSPAEAGNLTGSNSSAATPAHVGRGAALGQASGLPAGIGPTSPKMLTKPNSPPEAGCFCFDLYDPVCGVDGITYGNSCMASCAGITEFRQGGC